MSQFFKTHSYNMVKMLLNQIAVAIFGFVLALATAVNIPWLCTISSTLAVLFYLFLLYMAAWEMGYKERNAVEHGQYKASLANGFFISLCANIPNYLLAIFIMLATLLNNEVLSNIGGVCASISIVIEGMWSGLLRLRVNDVPLNSLWFIYFIIPIPSMIVSGIAYIFGRKDLTKTKLFTPLTPLSDRETKE